MKNDVAARFDRVAANWDANAVRVALAKRVADAIRQAIPLRPDMQVIDVGAVTGLLTLALLPHVGAVTAVDTSSMMLGVLDGKLASLKIGNVRTLHGDVTETPLPDNAIVSSMAMHHMRDVPAVLTWLRPCLRRDGWIAVADLDAEDGTFHADASGVYHRGFERRVVCAWLEQAGFVNVALRDAHRIDRDGRQYGVFLATGRGDV